MGAWGAGLYSSDFALDLRSDFRAVTRLPFDGEKLIELLCSFEPGAANRPDDEDHATFWLVAADQFAKGGIPCERARQKALQIIDDGTDIAMLARLGMDPAGLGKRRKMLAALREELVAAPRPAKPRSVIQRPQPLLMDIGDVFVYPTSLGRAKQYCPASVRVIPPWQQDGWSAAVILSAERAFDFLAWYRPLTLASARGEEPDFARLRQAGPWVLRSPGTCKPADIKRLGLKKVGTVPVDGEKLKRVFPALPSGVSAAIGDRSIGPELNAGSTVGESFLYAGKLERTPEGRAILQERIKAALETYERIRAAREASGPLTTRRNPTIPGLDEILG
ncbi:MAG TPA: hypothetical protein VGS20_00725 [Candidatus Acidoferrales bacterium]|nr:hypothetical protein [Candidatus Acidoferrales bacterium]